MLNSITRYLFTSARTNGNLSENEEIKSDKVDESDGWVFVEKPSEYYGDYEDNTEDDDNDRGYSPIRSHKKDDATSDTQSCSSIFLEPLPPKKSGSPKLNNHHLRQRRMSSGSIQVSMSRSNGDLDLKEYLSSDEQQHQHSDFERYRGPYLNLLEDEQKKMKKEGGVLSSASSQPEIVNIPSLEEHWVLSPAPCFVGKPQTCLKSSMEDLLIERPTASIYLKFIGEKTISESPSKSEGKGSMVGSMSSHSRKIGDSNGKVEDHNDITASGFFHGLMETNGFDSFDSRLITYDAIYPNNHRVMRSRLDLKDNDGWSSESSTRDHSLSRPPIRSYAARNKQISQKPGLTLADESSEMSERLTYVGPDPYDELGSSTFFTQFDDDEMRVKNKRKLLPKHQRSHTRMKIWQKPRKPSANNQTNGCK